MKISIHRLKVGDEAVLQTLAREDADFDIEGRGEPLDPLTSDAARDFLSDPSVLHWIAEDETQIVGFLFCYALKMRAGKGREILLYEIGIRKGFRRQGVGRALQETAEGWMRENEISEMWVLADNPQALGFYKSCGFEGTEQMAVYLTKTIGGI